MRRLWFIALISCSLLFAETPTDNVPLVNHDGKAFQLYDLKGSNVVPSFVFTRCPLPKMCPLTMQLNKKLLAEWKKRKDTRKLHLLILTLDPDFDTPERLKAYGEAQGVRGDQVTLATGNPASLTEFASRFNVIGIPRKGSVAHNLKTVVLDPHMVPQAEFKENEWDAGKILEKLK